MFGNMGQTHNKEKKHTDRKCGQADQSGTRDRPLRGNHNKARQNNEGLDQQSSNAPSDEHQMVEVTEISPDSLRDQFQRYEQLERAAASRQEINAKLSTATGVSILQPSVSGPSLFVQTNIPEKDFSDVMENVGPNQDQRRKFSERLNEIDNRFTCMHGNEEVNEIHQKITSFLKDVLENLGWSQPLFKGSLTPAGSFPEGTKLKAPDEFDFMVELAELNDSCELIYPYPDKPGVVKLKSANPHFLELQDEDGFLDPILLSEEFRKRLTEVILVIPTPEKLEFGPRFSIYNKQYKGASMTNLRTHGRSTMVDFVWKGGPLFLQIRIDVDVVPAVKMSGWPKAAKFPQTDDTNLGEERYSHMTLMKSRGYNVVPTISDTWQISFAGIETTLMNYYGQYGNMLRVYRLCKIMNQAQIEMNGTMQIRYLPTYFLKNIFFYECEFVPDKKDWAVDKLYERVTSILRNFVACIDNNHMPGYFIPSHNVMDDKNSPMLCMLVADLFSQVFMHGVYSQPNSTIQQTHKRLQNEMMIKSMMIMMHNDSKTSTTENNSDKDDKSDDACAGKKVNRKPNIVNIEFSGNKMKFLTIDEKASDRVL